jgi:hypothetical protein
MWTRERKLAGLLAPLALVALLTLVACSGAYPFALPPTAAPSWPAGTPPRPALAYPAQSATTKGFIDSSEGWFFQPLVDIEVTGLGYYDDGQDGLLHAHRSAIIDSATGRAVVETVIGPQSPLDGPFRWETVGPVRLSAGHKYVMVSSREAPFDPQVPNPKDASLAPELLYLGYREAQTDGAVWDQAATDMGDVLFSGNFKFEPVPAPERRPNGSLD